MVKTTHAGSLFVRHAIDTFTIQGLSGEHICLVHEPLGISLARYRSEVAKGPLSVTFIKFLLRHLVLALDHLHTEANMVHTDIQPRNIHFTVEPALLEELDERVTRRPCRRKIDGDRIIYESVETLLNLQEIGRPVLIDFGEARYGQETYTDLIQPFLYRAPEVKLGMPWSYPADIWNLGVLTWDLLEADFLFNGDDENGKQSGAHLLAEIYALLGRPPADFLRRSEMADECFYEDGRWKASDIQIPEMSMESRVKTLDGEEKAEFLRFLRRMLQWVPEERATAKQLREDVWLK